MYSLDSAGLIQCYIAGLPFLKYTLAGDLFWSVVLFGSLTVLGAAARPRAGELSAAPDEDLLEQAARLPLRLGELQADRDHAVVHHRMGHELDRAERNGVVRPRRMLDEIEREVIGERRLRILGRNLEPVDFAERPERDLARHEEILDQVGVGAACGGRSAKKRSSACTPIGRRQEIDVIAFADLRGLLRGVDTVVTHHQRQLGP